MVRRCQICSGRFERAGFVRCPDCDRVFHEGCIEYHSTYECEKGAEEPAIGAVEL